MRLMAAAIESVPPNPKNPWNKRIVLGCWAVRTLVILRIKPPSSDKIQARFFPLAAHYLPTFSITNISFSPAYSRQFLSLPNVSFNMLQQSLVGPIGSRFVRDAKAAGRPLFHWTVNQDDYMRWSIKHGADGVITDNPKRFLEVCDEWEHGKRKIHFNRKQWFQILWLNSMIILFTCIFWWRFGALPGGKPTRRPRRSRENQVQSGPGVSVIEHKEDQ